MIAAIAKPNRALLTMANPPTDISYQQYRRFA
jgi:hypothetical protein